MIRFTTDSAEMPSLDIPRISLWLQEVAAGYNKQIGHLNYIFCNDERILEVNRQFLGHDYYTDIITFDYSCFPVISGDIFISLDTVRSNAGQENVSFDEELHRILVHGLLHLTGQGDKTPDTKAEMTAKENEALAKL